MIWRFTSKPVTLEDIKAQVGPGWGPLLEELVNDLLALGWDGTVWQVKEKFGGLRFYIGSASDEVWERIVKAEKKSFEICEHCGKPGKPDGPGWILTLCDDCRLALLR
jgi:hypothetical protein